MCVPNQSKLGFVLNEFPQFIENVVILFYRRTFGDVSKKERNQNKKERNRIQKKRLKIEQPAICDPEKELNIEGNVNVNIDDDCKN